MTESNERLELPDRYRKHLDETTVEWFRHSPLPEDTKTRQVIEHLEYVRRLDAPALEPDIITAHLHRAPTIARDREDREIASPDDIPGELPDTKREALKGYPSQTALRTHCTSVESETAAVRLGMATRWADGQESHKWAKRRLNRIYSSGDGQPIGPTEELSTIESAEQDIVGL